MVVCCCEGLQDEQVAVVDTSTVLDAARPPALGADFHEGHLAEVTATSVPVDLINDLEEIGVAARQVPDEAAPGLDGVASAAERDDTEKEEEKVERGCSAGSRTKGRRISRHLRVSSDDLAPDVANVITFRGHKELLRASRLYAVMASCAAVLASPAGSEKTWALSEEVQLIDAFLSHNWVVSRAKKFLCLALYYNLTSAIIAEVAVIALIVAMGAAAAGPGIARQELIFPGFIQQPGDLDREHGLSATLFVGPLFFLVLMSGHELRRLAGFRGPLVFLDKTCIHQVDKVKQRHGILKLGAFLRSSSRLVILYTDIYLMKVWTVYEIACFLSLHPSSRITVIPTLQPINVFIGTASLYMVGLTWRLFRMPVLLLSFQLLAVGSVVACLRRFARMREGIHMRMMNFEIDSCICFCPEDRPVVYHNITLLMRAIGEVSQDAAEADALIAFNRIVQRRLPTALTTSFGRFGLRYLHVVGCIMCMDLAQCVDIHLGGVFPHQHEWITRYRLANALFNVVWVTGFYPLVFTLLSTWCGCWLHLRGVREGAFLGLGAVLGGSLVSALKQLEQLVIPAATAGARRDEWLAGLVFLLLISTSLAIAIFSGRHPWAWRKDEDEEDEEDEELEDEAQQQRQD